MDMALRLLCGELIRSRAFVFLVTHFQEPTSSLTVYHTVVNLHLETELCLGVKSAF